MGNIRYQTIEVIRANGASTPADEKFKFDPEYKRVTGVRAYLVADGGQTHIEIALKDRSKTYHNLSPDEDWKPTVGYFYKPLNIIHQAEDFYITTKLPAANTSELKLIVVFTLEN